MFRALKSFTVYVLPFMKIDCMKTGAVKPGSICTLLLTRVAISPFT